MRHPSDVTDAEETTTLADLGEPSVLSVPDCDDDISVEAGCIFGFFLDDKFHTVGCTGVRPDLVTDQVVGKGVLENRDVTVNLIRGVDRSVMVAVRLDCRSEGGDIPTEWKMVFPEGGDEEALGAAICQVGALTPAQRTTNGC